MKSSRFILAGVVALAVAAVPESARAGGDHHSGGHHSGGHHGGGHHGGGHHSGGHHGGGHHGGGHHSGGHYSGGHYSGGHHYGHGIGLLGLLGFSSHRSYGYSGYGYRYPSYGYGYPRYGYTRAAYAYRAPTDGLAVDVQIELARRGYYRGPIDGIIGSGTRRALRHFQIDRRLPVSGRIDRYTLDRLGIG